MRWPAAATATGDGIGRGLSPGRAELRHCLARPGPRDGEKEGIALGDCLEPTLGGGCKSKTQFRDLGEPPRLACLHGAVGLDEEHRIVAGGAEGEKVREPRAQRRRIRDVARLMRPFQSMRIREGPDREGRGEPDEKGQMRGHQCSCLCP
jgi:hypothetical protein